MVLSEWDGLHSTTGPATRLGAALSGAAGLAEITGPRLQSCGGISEVGSSIGSVFQIYQNSLYRLSQSAKTWEEAQAEALELGGNLVTISDAAEQQWLEQTFGTEETLWTGLTDQAIEGQFRWISGEETAYRNWAPGQPVTDPFAAAFAECEDYATLNFEDTAQWADSAGSDRYRSIIEIPLNPTVSSDADPDVDHESFFNLPQPVEPQTTGLESDTTQMVSLRSAVVYDGSPTQPNLFLTFDDGPVEEQTLEILQVLDNHNAQASFFLMGQQVEHFPAETRAIAQAGHVIGNHTLTHPENLNEAGIADGLFGLPQKTVQQELDHTNQIIERVTGQTPRYFRPPYGSFDEQTLQVANGLGLETIQWSDGGETKDWLSETSPEDIVQDLLGNARNGQIFVLHDHGPSTVEALDIAIPQLQAQGYRFATLDELAE